MTTEKCKDRVGRNLEGRIEDLTKLWELYLEDAETHDEELGHIYEYGLCFDYVPPKTFTDQNEGYFRYQLSTGGPGDEFRIYAQKRVWHWSVYRIEYWFLDWFDGASVDLGLDSEYGELIEDIFQNLFVETGTANHVYQQAISTRGEMT